MNVYKEAHEFRLVLHNSICLAVLITTCLSLRRLVGIHHSLFHALGRKYSHWSLVVMKVS